jgi:hypothetical protein
MRRRVLWAVAAAVLLLGQLGAATAYADIVVSPGPVLQWNLNEGAGTTTADSSGNANTGTLTASSMWTTSFAQSGGTSATFVRASSQTINSAASAVNTTQSLTVAAWVRMTSTAGTEGLVGQAGTTASAFFLKYNSANTAWSFAMPESDVVSPVIDEAVGSGTAAVNTWTHLVGVYNATAGSMRLYINGTLNANAAHTVTWNATGKAFAGRLHWANVDQNYFDGQLDDIRIWNRALSDTDVSDLYNATATTGPALRWDMDEGSGTTTADRTGSNNYGTLGSAATWTTTAHSNGHALSFDASSNAYVAARGPAVDTTQSFSVAAWVNLASTSSTYIVASQIGTTSSAFILKYEPGGGINGWDFLMTQTDATSPVQDHAYTNGNASTGVWTHLVGVFNAGNNTTTLYVNGTQNATGTHSTKWNATGAVNIGRLRWNGAYNNNFTGKIDDVRIYQRVLSATDVTDLYNDVVPGLSGSVYLSTQPFLFGNRSMTGANANITVQPGTAWSVVDGRGTGAAWSATISATALTSAAGSVETTPRTIAVGQMSMANGTVTAGSLADPTTNLTSTGVTFSGSSQAFLSASGTSRGTYTFTPTLTIAVPANAYRSNYSGTIGGSAQNPYTATITVTIS